MRRTQQIILITILLLFAGLTFGAYGSETELAELEMDWVEGRSLNIDDEIRRQERVIGRLVSDITGSDEDSQDLLVAQDRSGLRVQLISKSQ